MMMVWRQVMLMLMHLLLLIVLVGKDGICMLLLQQRGCTDVQVVTAATVAAVMSVKQLIMLRMCLRVGLGVADDGAEHVHLCFASGSGSGTSISERERDGNIWQVASSSNSSSPSSSSSSSRQWYSMLV